jgi:hypothetical protein
MMSEKIFKYEGEEKEPGLGEIQVADLRHTRELAEPPEAPAAAPSEPAPPEKQAAPAPAVEPPADVEVETEVGMHEAAAATAEHGAHDHHAGEHEGHAHEGQGEEGAASAFEMEQLRLLFGGGLTAYLRGQLGLLFNFALISLGRMPNPATGIVAIDLDKAKTAIDVFEFLITRIQAELQPTERTETMNLIAELKYLFMQQAQAAAPQAPVMPGPV